MSDPTFNTHPDGSSTYKVSFGVNGKPPRLYPVTYSPIASKKYPEKPGLLLGRITVHTSNPKKNPVLTFIWNKDKYPAPRLWGLRNFNNKSPHSQEAVAFVQSAVNCFVTSMTRFNPGTQLGQSSTYTNPDIRALKIKKGDLRPAFVRTQPGNNGTKKEQFVGATLVGPELLDHDTFIHRMETLEIVNSNRPLADADLSKVLREEQNETPAEFAERLKQFKHVRSNLKYTPPPVSARTMLNGGVTDQLLVYRACRLWANPDPEKHYAKVISEIKHKPGYSATKDDIEALHFLYFPHKKLPVLTLSPAQTAKIGSKSHITRDIYAQNTLGKVLKPAEIDAFIDEGLRINAAYEAEHAKQSVKTHSPVQSPDL